jgi:multidrug efflux pump subunit AcrA (membrane-fusion protein)
LLDRQYEQQKLEASLRSQRESLLLHGLTAEQVEEISKVRTLRSSLTIYVPHLATMPEPGLNVDARSGSAESSRRSGNSPPDTASAANASDRLYVVNALNVETGLLVTAGDPLLSLSDYSELYAEGNAFEQDGQLVADALKNGWRVTAVVENHTAAGTRVPDLPILFLSDEVDPVSRTLHFYMRLPNERIRDEVTEGHRFVNWRFKPGQRTHLRVPVEEWADRIVLPADAIAQDGPESYVFQQNGDHFDRRPVQVEYRDLESAVIAQDGSLFPGDRVAMSGAQQMLMALKNKSGGGVDPHAGHNH